MFGSSGLVEQPESVRRSFVLRKPGVESHKNTKYLCRTSLLGHQSVIGIHKIHGADSARTVSDIMRFQLNHYPIQSLDFFTSVKMTRGDASIPRHDHVRDMDYFRRYDEGCSEIDRKLADLLGKEISQNSGAVENLNSFT